MLWRVSYTTLDEEKRDFNVKNGNRLHLPFTKRFYYELQLVIINNISFAFHRKAGRDILSAQQARRQPVAKFRRVRCVDKLTKYPFQPSCETQSLHRVGRWVGVGGSAGDAANVKG